MRPVQRAVLCRLLPAPFSLALRSLVLVLLCITRKSCTHKHLHARTRRLNEMWNIDCRGRLMFHYTPNKSGKQAHNVHMYSLISYNSQDWQFSIAQALCYFNLAFLQIYLYMMLCDAKNKIEYGMNWCKLIQSEIQCGAQHVTKGGNAADGIMLWTPLKKCLKCW